MLNDAWQDNFDLAAVVTNDSDLALPIQLAVARHKTVVVLHPDGNPSRSLQNSASGLLHIHDAHLKNAQLPNEIPLPNGKIIRKPTGF